MKTILRAALLALFALPFLGKATMAQPLPVPQETPVWQALLSVQWKRLYSEEFERDIQFPVFPEKIEALEGKRIDVTGYIIPVEVDGDYVVLSMNPFASCYFCGGAGPETVVEVRMKMKRSFMKDDLVTLRGTLSLNRTDIEHLIYVLKDAELMREHY